MLNLEISGNFIFAKTWRSFANMTLPSANALLVLVQLTISHHHTGAANTKKIWEMCLLLLPVRIFMAIGGNMSVPALYW